MVFCRRARLASRSSGSFDLRTGRGELAADALASSALSTSADVRTLAFGDAVNATAIPYIIFATE